MLDPIDTFPRRRLQAAPSGARLRSRKADHYISATAGSRVAPCCSATARIAGSARTRFRSTKSASIAARSRIERQCAQPAVKDRGAEEGGIGERGGMRHRGDGVYHRESCAQVLDVRVVTDLPEWACRPLGHLAITAPREELADAIEELRDDLNDAVRAYIKLGKAERRTRAAPVEERREGLGRAGHRVQLREHGPKRRPARSLRQLMRGIRAPEKCPDKYKTVLRPIEWLSLCAVRRASRALARDVRRAALHVRPPRRRARARVDRRRLHRQQDPDRRRRGTTKSNA